jgi:hypothetical protein
LTIFCFLPLSCIPSCKSIPAMSAHAILTFVCLGRTHVRSQTWRIPYRRSSSISILSGECTSAGPNTWKASEHQLHAPIVHVYQQHFYYLSFPISRIGGPILIPGLLYFRTCLGNFFGFTCWDHLGLLEANPPQRSPDLKRGWRAVWLVGLKPISVLFSRWYILISFDLGPFFFRSFCSSDVYLIPCSGVYTVRSDGQFCTTLICPHTSCWIPTIFIVVNVHHVLLSCLFLLVWVR